MEGGDHPCCVVACWSWIKSWFSFFFSSRRRHTRCGRDWNSDVCSSDLGTLHVAEFDMAILAGRGGEQAIGDEIVPLALEEIGRASCRERAQARGCVRSLEGNDSDVGIVRICSFWPYVVKELLNTNLNSL